MVDLDIGQYDGCVVYSGGDSNRVSDVNALNGMDITSVEVSFCVTCVTFARGAIHC